MDWLSQLERGLVTHDDEEKPKYSDSPVAVHVWPQRRKTKKNHNNRKEYLYVAPFKTLNRM